MRPVAVIIDSIQTVYLENVTGSAGSVSQVRDPPLLLNVCKPLTFLHIHAVSVSSAY